MMVFLSPRRVREMSPILGSLGVSLRCNAGSVVIIVLTCTSVGELLTAAGHPGASTLVMRIILEWLYANHENIFTTKI